MLGLVVSSALVNVVKSYKVDTWMVAHHTRDPGGADKEWSWNIPNVIRSEDAQLDVLYYTTPAR